MSSHTLILCLRRHLAWDIVELGIHATDLQKANITARHNALQRKLESWTQIQLLYMPSVTALWTSDKLQNGDVMSENKPEKVRLWVPSKLPANTPCDP